MKIRAIPQIPNHLDPQLRMVLLALKEAVETISGQRGDAISALSAEATLPEAVNKINELVSRAS